MNRLPPWIKTLGANLAWLLLSLLLAIFVWVAATTRENPVESRAFPQRIPIDIMLDDGMIITNNPSATAQVILRAQTNVWNTLQASDILVSADLRGKLPGTYPVDLSIAFATVNRVVVEDYQPQQITVTIDQAAERLVPINAEVRVQPPTGFEVAAITYSTQETRITGPASLVNRVASAAARLSLGDDRNAFTRNYRLFALDADGRTVPDVVLSPDNVDVGVDIQPRENFRQVYVTPNIIGEPASGYVIYSITYEPQTILVSGRPSALEQITGTIQTAPIDLTGQTSSFSRTVSVDLPVGVILATEGGITVNVQIDTLTASRRFEHLPVQVQGLDAESNLEAIIAPSEVTMLITGPQPILDTLTPESISILANLTDLPPGGHQVPLQAIVNREGLASAVISVLPPVLDVQIVQKTPEAATATLAPTLGGIIIPAPSNTPPAAP